jgi:hypothetical protein
MATMLVRAIKEAELLASETGYELRIVNDNGQEAWPGKQTINEVET